MTDDAEIGRDVPLNGQQMAALDRKFRAELATRISDVELRKLALDQACRVVNDSNRDVAALVKFTDPLALAREMHAFLSEPLAGT